VVENPAGRGARRGGLALAPRSTFVGDPHPDRTGDFHPERIRSSRKFSAASLRQPFVRRRGPRSAAFYDLCAIQADGTVVTLAEGFASDIEAWSAEHKIEEALGIIDAPVPGEIDRPLSTLVNTTAPMRAIGLVCPACATPLTAHEVHLGKGQAVCAGCRKGMLLGGPAAAGPRTLVVLPPARAHVERSPNAFAIESGLGTGGLSAIKQYAVSLATFAGIGAAFTIARGHAANLVLWSGMAFVWARWGWLVAVRQWNRVRIRVEDGVLDVRVGPLPPRTRQAIPVANISQLFVRDQPKSVVTGGVGYQLCAIHRVSMAEFQVIPLVGWMMDLREARYLEEQLEDYLGIVDAPVSGEVEGKMLQPAPGASSLPESGNLSLPDSSAGGELSVPRDAGALSDPD
jgi:hypothetical protein